jgi:hypothetical protein
MGLFYYGRNDVIAISAARWHLGVFKMADSESLTTICHKRSVVIFWVSSTVHRQRVGASPAV